MEEGKNNMVKKQKRTKQRYALVKERNHKEIEKEEDDLKQILIFLESEEKTVTEIGRAHV